METGMQKRRVLVTEVVHIPRPTVQGLIEAFRDVFRSPFRVERMRYTRGDEGLVVERLIPEDQVASRADSAFLSAYQMVKQHADMEVQEPVAAPVEAIARAVQSLSSRNIKLTMFVVESREAARAWVGKDLRIEDIWQVPLVEDPDALERGLFVCGSRSGNMVQDIESAVFCRME
jgi:hypothetical protein